MLFNKRKKLNIFILLAAAAAVLSLPVAATATKLIPSDLSIGTWDSANRIYTLNTNVSETIQIDEDNLTLDGAGYTVTGAGSGSGVYLEQRSYVTITNLTVEGFYNGIHLYDDCQYNTLTGNTASNNFTGIFLYYNTSNNTLTCNTTASNNGYGIYLFTNSSTNTLTGNTVSNNISTGIYLSQSSNDNTLTGNTVASNPTGILLSGSSTNEIYNNNFIENTMQAYVWGGGGNVFNLSEAEGGGNYWSNWTSPDVAPEDGFVDSPYTFIGGQDNLPWTEMDGWQQTPSEMMLDLADDVIALNLQRGISNSLDAKLNAALGALDDINANNDVAAINTLQAFINAVEAQRGNKITEADADDLIDTANNIIVALQNGCY